MTKVAVIAHAGKSFGDGLARASPRARRARASTTRSGSKCRRAVRAEAGQARARAKAAELLFAWGGDGTVQQCVDAARWYRDAARDPAGRHGEPARDEPRHPAGHRARGCDRAARRAPQARRRAASTASTLRVMAGIGFDAAMIQQADGTLKDRFGRAAYVWTGSKNLRAKPFKAKIKVDGVPLVRRRRELHPRRQCRSSLRRHRGVRGRTTRRRSSSTSASSTRKASSIGSARSPARRRPSRALAARAGDESGEDLGEAEPQGPRTRSTAAIASRSRPSRSAFSRAAITICVPTDDAGADRDDST